MKNWIQRRHIVFLVLLIPLLFFQGVSPHIGYAESSLTITSHQNGDRLPVDVVRISGSYSAVKNIEVIIDAKTVNKAQLVPNSSESGEWFYDLDTNEIDGSVEIVLKGTSTITRYSTWSEPLLLEVDNNKANTPKVMIQDPKTDTSITKNTKVTVTASGKNDIEAVYIRVNGGEWTLTKKNSDIYTYHLVTLSERDKTYSIEAKAMDSLGNIGLSQTVYVRTGNGRSVDTTPEKQDRAMWIWENASYNLIYNEGSRKVLDAFAKDTTTFNQDAITTLYLGVDRYYGVDMLEDERERVRNFISWAHQKGYKVHALIAGGTKPPHFGAFDRYHEIALREVENIINYNLSSRSEEQFDGVNIDIEPYIASQFKTEKPSLQIQYLNLLEKMMDLKRVSDSSLSMGAAIPNWYDSSPYAENITWGPNLNDGERETKWLSEHIQDILDYISIMDYRDFAEGSNGIIERALDEIEYAVTINKPNSVVIGVETKDIADGGDPELISFREEGRTYMEQELDKVYATMNSSPSFGGIALHHYDTLRYLPSEWSDDGVFWEPPLDTEAPTQVDRQPKALPTSYQSIFIDYGRAYDNGEVEHYAIYRGLTPDFTPDESNLAGESRGLSYVDEGLLADTTYYYKVAAVDVNGNIGPVSAVASATTNQSSLKPLKVEEASIIYSNGKAEVTITVSDLKTGLPVKSNLSGRFEFVSGKVVNGTTNDQGQITFTSETLGTHSGKIGFKINAITAAGYYWASSKDVSYDLQTTWAFERMSESEDAYIRSDSYGDINYGDSPILEVKGLEESFQSYDRKAYIQFSSDPSSLDNLARVTLKFYVDRGISDSEVSSVPLSIYGAVNQEWNEENITWNSQPDSLTFSKVGEVGVSAKGWYQIDLTEWASSLENVHSLTFRLSDDALMDRLVPIQSKENTNAPTLEIRK
ncbi:fibronectin [Pontibacillus chungwhensis BH030062]|uniref:Fibronectin n=1 Tax=Pontibacillus chungwhensis BH030062 TaxID=1385513 RepID=A0A0A2VHA0_9BACI|nr:DNRLRE domain-containing protein [Pontibacillus chungwhensis]KGP92995.1 fibronectin [Pontibacillus chungwhensis BH030062]